MKTIFATTLAILAILAGPAVSARAGVVVYDFETVPLTTTTTFVYSLPIPPPNNTGQANLVATFSDPGAPSQSFTVSNGIAAGLSGHILTANTTGSSTVEVNFDSPLNYATVKFAFTGTQSGNGATLQALDGMGNVILTLTQTVGGNSGSLTVGSLDGSTFFSAISIGSSSGAAKGTLNLDDLGVNPVPEIDASSTVSAFALLGTACVMIRSRRRHATC